jgi:hypothetical protein
MEEIVSIEKVYKELLALRNEVHYIKEHMVDTDVVLTPEEDAELDESLKDLDEGKIFSLEEIKKDRENA